jgi:hypothetical protein
LVPITFLSYQFSLLLFVTCFAVVFWIENDCQKRNLIGTDRWTCDGWLGLAPVVQQQRLNRDNSNSVRVNASFQKTSNKAPPPNHGKNNHPLSQTTIASSWLSLVK